MRSLKKLLLGAVTAMVLAAGVAVSPASATVPSKGKVGIGENANVPYLAWRGEHVRLGFCTTNNVVGLPGGPYLASWQRGEWSGDPANFAGAPYEMENSRSSSTSGEGECFYSIWTAQKAGVTFIKLTLTGEGGAQFYHDFIVIWMDALKPEVTGGGDVDPADFCLQKEPGDAELSISDYNGVGHAKCDPDNDPRHHVKVVVKGYVPLAVNFKSEWGLGDHLTFPDDWAKLATRAATCSYDPINDPLSCHTPGEASTISNWDIHDDQLKTEGHVKTGGYQCAVLDETNVEDTTDAVDNCVVAPTQSLALLWPATGSDGPFSTVFGVPTWTPTWGPYDPLFANETLLSDGKVDAGDAPMPAIRVDMWIVQNTLAKTDISGVGYLNPSAKSDVYSKDGLGSNTAHNFYAPYYSQYIPASTRPPINGVLPTGTYSSGVAGFNGYLNNPSLYTNWDFAWWWSFRAEGYTDCLAQQSYLPFKKYFRPLPSGIDSVSVYTDEHGETIVDFIPGLGMYFDNLLGANKNLNNGCDLEGVKPLGTATIKTAVRYPFQAVTAGDPAGDDVKFTVGNLFEKSLAVYSKGVDKNNITSNSVAKIVLAHAQDIDGSPLAYEQVCWMADSNAAGLRVFSGDLPAPTTEDPDAVIHLNPWTASHAYQDPYGLNRLCTFTDWHGNSAIEVYNSHRTGDAAAVDVIAEFVNEGIIRDTIADFSTATFGATTSADGPPTSHVPSQQTLNQAIVVGASGPVVATKSAVKTIKSKQAKTLKKVLHKIRFAKVVTPFHGKAKLQVRINGKAGLVGLRITIKKGGKTHTYTRFVPANRLITVKNLVIPAKTAKVTVKLLGL